jgi:glycosyltransferase involved in cell wall biosynthesis
MKVLWLLKTYDLGGAERSLAELAPRMPDVRFVPMAVMAQPRDVVPVLEAVGLRPRDLGMTSDLDPRWIWRLRREVRRLQPDIVHVHSPYPAALWRLGRIGLPQPMLYTEHNVWSAYRRQTRWANAVTFPLSTATIAVSEPVRRSIAASWWGRRGVGRTDVIVNGIDRGRVITDARGPIGEPSPPRPSIGTVANLRPEKSIDLLLDAFASLTERFSAEHCTIVGGGPLEAEVRARAAGVPRARVLGRRTDARAIMAGFDVFVLSSRAEGLPLALLEAMTLERPVVATAVGGVPDVIRHGENGLLVPPGDAHALADAIAGLLQDPARAAELGRAAAADVERAWDADACAAALTARYEEVA